MAKLAAIVAVLLGAYLWIDHRSYARGYEAKNAEVLKEAARLNKQAARVNAALATAQADRDTALNSRLDNTRTQGDRLQTIILKETASAPRYSDPACDLTDGVFAAVNAARGLSSRFPVDATSGFTVPAAAGAGR